MKDREQEEGCMYPHRWNLFPIALLLRNMSSSTLLTPRPQHQTHMAASSQLPIDREERSMARNVKPEGRKYQT